MRPPRHVALMLFGAALAASPASGFAAGKVYTVVIQSMAFGPTPTGLHVGDAIEWVNNDIFRHSATAADNSFDVDLKPATHARVVMNRAGVVRFSCRFHPGMTGRLIVAK